jgi:hypothetical protein
LPGGLATEHQRRATGIQKIQFPWPEAFTTSAIAATTTNPSPLQLVALQVHLRLPSSFSYQSGLVIKVDE